MFSSNVNCNHNTCGCLALSFNTQRGFCSSLVFSSYPWTPRIIRKCMSLWSSSSPGVNYSAPVQFLIGRLYLVCWFWCDRPAENADTVTWKHQALLVGSVDTESSLKGLFPLEMRKDLRGTENERTHYHTLSTGSIISNEDSHNIHYIKS